MRNGMYVALGSIAFGFLIALKAIGQPERPPQAQPLPRQQAEPAQPVPKQPQPKPDRDLVATVNGDAVTRAEFEGQVQSALQVRRRQNAAQPQPSPQEVQRLRQQVLDNLIEARLIEQYVLEHGPDIEQKEVEEVLEGVQKKLQTQGTTLHQYLASSKQTAEELRTRIEGSIAWQKYQQEQMSPGKLRQFYEDQRQRFGQATFEQVQPQVTQLYVNKIWNDIVEQMKPKAKIQLARPPQGAGPQMPPRQPPVPPPPQ